MNRDAMTFPNLASGAGIRRLRILFLLGMTQQPPGLYPTSHPARSGTKNPLRGTHGPNCIERIGLREEMRSAGIRYPPRGLLFFRPFGAVLGPLLFPSAHTLAIETSADDVISHPRQVFHAAPANHHDGVLLQIMPLARNVRGDFESGREAHSRDFAQGRVRFFGRRHIHTRADAATLGRPAQSRCFVLSHLDLPAMPHQLLDRGHTHSFATRIIAECSFGRRGCQVSRTDFFGAGEAYKRDNCATMEEPSALSVASAVSMSLNWRRRLAS